MGITGNTVGTLSISEASITGSGQAVDINTGNLSSVSFERIAVTSSSAEGIDLDNVSGSFSVNDGNGGTTNDLDINATSSGAGIDIDNSSAAFSFSSVEIDNTSAQSIQLTNNTGSFTVSGGTIGATNDPTGDGVDISGGNATVNIAATITKTSAGEIADVQSRTGGTVTFSGNLTCNTNCTGLNVQNNTGGTTTFSAGTKTINTGTNTAVNLNENTGHTVTFTGGGLDIDTTSGTGFASTNGAASIEVTGSTNTINSTTGTALSLAGTGGDPATIGANGLIFQSISTTTASANPGIVLTNTGNSGGLTVTGTGSSANCRTGGTGCTGGTISNKTGNGIELTSASNVSLTRMNISSNNNSGVSGTTVTNFSLINSFVDNNTDSTAGIEAGLSFTNLLGTSAITNSRIRRSTEHNIEIQHTSGTLTALNIVGSTIEDTDAGTGADGMLYEASGSANGTISVQTSTFDDNLSDGIQIVSRGSAIVNFSATTSTFSNGARALNLSNANSATLTFNVTANTQISGFTALDEAINIASASTTTNTALLSGSVLNHTMGVVSSIPGGFIGLDTRGDGTVRVRVDNNVATSERQVLDFIHGDSAGDNGDTDITITNNNMTATGNAMAANNEGIAILVDRDVPGCFNIRGNTADGSGSREGIALEDVTDLSGSVRLESSSTECGGAMCANAEAHLLAANTIPDAFADTSIILVALGTCGTP